MKGACRYIFKESAFQYSVDDANIAIKKEKFVKDLMEVSRPRASDSSTRT